jgi:hypothetical protein
VTTYLDDPFTGTNGAAWSGSWVAGNSTSGASATIQSNMGRLNAGSLTGYTGKAARRISGLSIVDGRVRLYNVTFRGTVDGSLTVCLRSDTDLDSGNGYYLLLDRGAGNVRVVRWLSYGQSVLGSQSYSFVADAPHDVDFYVAGTSIKAWVWPSGDSKPTSPTLQFTNSEVSSAGVVGVVGVGGNAANGLIDIDRAVVTDGSGDLTITGLIAATGSLVKTPGKRLTGSITPSGATTRIKVILRTFTGSITGAGTLLRTRLRTFTGSITPAGTKIATPRKILTGSAQPAGAIKKGLLRTFTGSITPAGALVTNYLGRLVGDSATVQMTARALSWVRITIRRWID